MKVVVLSGGVPSDKYPLNGIFAFDQAKALKDFGHDVYFLSVDLRSFRRVRKFGITSGETEGIKWCNLSIPVGPFPRLLAPIGRLAVNELYRRFFVNNKPDIIHAHFGDIGDLALNLKLKYDIPYVLTEHSSYMNGTNIPDKKLRELKKFYLNANALLAVSSLLSRSILEKTGVNSIVVPNIINTSLFSLKDPSTYGHLRIVTTALLSKRKRIGMLLEALNNLQSKLNGIHLDIIGDGEEYDTLKKYAEDHFPEKMYKFWGLLSREEANFVYKNADCFVLPSSLETFGVVYVEAMAAGLPVIATKCGGPEDFVNEKNGILIDVDNHKQLEKAIEYIYYHLEDYNNVGIREYVTKKFSPQVIAKELSEIYNKVLNI